MASISGSVTIAGDPDDWIACAFDADTHAFAGAAVVATGSYEITGLTAGKAYVVACRPKSGGAWAALSAYGLDGYVIPTNPSSTPYLFKATEAGDPYFSDVILQIECEGAVDSTTFTDSSDLSVVISAHGGAKISATQVKHGSTSGYLASSGYLDMSSNDAFLFAGDFTVEFWSYGNITSCAIFSNAAQTYLYNNDFRVANTSVVSSLGFATTAAWRHYAVCRSGTSVRVFENGIQKGSTGTKSGNVDFRGLNIGRYQPNNNLFFTGYIDDFRVTKYARYTGSFTPPGAFSASLSGSSEPTWPSTAGQTVTDGDVTWTNMGRMVKPLMQGPLIAA